MVMVGRAFGGGGVTVGSGITLLKGDVGVGVMVGSTGRVADAEGVASIARSTLSCM
jgi:hypothetical protein